jgi:hypothetical protein
MSPSSRRAKHDDARSDLSREVLRTFSSAKRAGVLLPTACGGRLRSAKSLLQRLWGGWRLALPARTHANSRTCHDHHTYFRCAVMRVDSHDVLLRGAHLRFCKQGVRLRWAVLPARWKGRKLPWAVMPARWRAMRVSMGSEEHPLARCASRAARRATKESRPATEDARPATSMGGDAASMAGGAVLDGR